MTVQVVARDERKGLPIGGFSLSTSSVHFVFTRLTESEPPIPENQVSGGGSFTALCASIPG
jgi:hypothetical protein